MISKGNHVLLAVIKEAKTLFFCFVQCIITQLLDSIFVIFRIIKVSPGKGYQTEPSASADNLYRDLDNYSGYHKKSHPIIVYNNYSLMSIGIADIVLKKLKL